MSLNGLGDLAQSYAMRAHNLSVRRELDALVSELATGESADIPKRLRGDFNGLAAVEAGLTRLGAFSTVLIESENFAGGMQTALSAVQETLSDSGPKLIAAVKPGEDRLLNATLAEAGHHFDAIVSQINGRDGDRSLFAGNAVDQPALAPAEDILAALSTALAGLTTAADVRTAVDAWFDTPGGDFETLAYLGSDDPIDPYRISDTAEARLDLLARDDEIRAVLKEFSIAALLDDGLLATDLNERQSLAEEAGLGMINAERALVSARARIGTEQAHIETTAVRNAAERTSLLTARDGLVGVDPYETATRLEDAETQLQILYNVTARLAGLSLSEYLR